MQTRRPGRRSSIVRQLLWRWSATSLHYLDVVRRRHRFASFSGAAAGVTSRPHHSTALATLAPIIVSSTFSLPSSQRQLIDYYTHRHTLCNDYARTPLLWWWPVSASDNRLIPLTFSDIIYYWSRRCCRLTKSACLICVIHRTGVSDISIARSYYKSTLQNKWIISMPLSCVSYIELLLTHPVDQSGALSPIRR